MADMDQGVKRAVLNHPENVVELALPGAEYLESVPVDVAAEPQLVLDTLLRVRYHGVECLVDIEAEASPRPDIGRRCFEYGARASILHQLPVVSVVLWLEQGNRPPSSPYVMRVGDLEPATWPFRGIALYELPAERVLSGDLAGLVGLLPLVPFMQGGKEIAIIERAARLIQAGEPDPERQSVSEALLALFAARHLGDEGVLALFRRLFMSTEILDQSPLYRRWIAEGEAKGVRGAVRTALLGRWGELPADVEAAVETASLDTLDDVLAHVATDTLEQMRARLGL